MKRLSKWVIFAAAALLFASCAKPPAAEPTAAAPTAAPQPTEAPVSQKNSCLECHSDKDELVANAKEEVKVESESTGVG